MQRAATYELWARQAMRWVWYAWLCFAALFACDTFITNIMPDRQIFWLFASASICAFVVDALIAVTVRRKIQAVIEQTEPERQRQEAEAAAQLAQNQLIDLSAKLLEYQDECTQLRALWERYGSQRLLVANVFRLRQNSGSDAMQCARLHDLVLHTHRDEAPENIIRLAHMLYDGFAHISFWSPNDDFLAVPSIEEISPLTASLDTDFMKMPRRVTSAD